MGAYGDEATITEAKRRFEAHVNKTSILPADIRGPVSVLCPRFSLMDLRIWDWIPRREAFF